ncbi:hypothetical protein IMG5_171630, partial [Ichthyophthirius multifiliis]
KKKITKKSIKYHQYKKQMNYPIDDHYQVEIALKKLRQKRLSDKKKDIFDSADYFIQLYGQKEQQKANDINEKDMTEKSNQALQNACNTMQEKYGTIQNFKRKLSLIQKEVTKNDIFLYVQKKKIRKKPNSILQIILCKKNSKVIILHHSIAQKINEKNNKKNEIQKSIIYTYNIYYLFICFIKKV